MCLIEVPLLWVWLTNTTGLPPLPDLEKLRAVLSCVLHEAVPALTSNVHPTVSPLTTDDGRLMPR